MQINLMSDTVTRPTPGMREAMMNAQVGDDVFGQDPSVNALQEKAAALFGKEAALYCPSGTMTNQIAIKVHTNPLDEVICDKDSHVYQYETGGYAFNSGVGIKLLDGTNGKVTTAHVAAAINGDFDWLPKSKLVVLENTCNKGGGSFYTHDEIAPISEFCRSHGLSIHLDGARLFNALIETGESTLATGGLFDSISICLSKGLGAPVGSLLIGDRDFIKEARRFRKVMGGGMRQAGFMAAAGIYALDHHVDRMKIDNDRAKRIGQLLEQQDYVAAVSPVKSNIVIFDLQKPWMADDFLAALAEKEVLAVPFGPNTVRFTFHLDITEEMVERLVEVISTFK